MKRYLPTLISIHVSNYSLYPNGLNLKYDFVQGLNLIFGGNGVGKTTFVNLIRYALIGPYVNELDLTRTYQGRAIEKRKLLPSNYFYNRMDTTFLKNAEAEVTLLFKINNIKFKVTRSLTEDCLLKSVIINQNDLKTELKGDLIPEHKYDRLTSKRENYLPYNYEEAIKKYTNLETFDDVILFVTRILYFDEGHKAIIWDDEKGEDSIQKTLLSKYLLKEKGLDIQREEAIRKTKYYDSLSRHNSEDIRAITNLMKSLKEKGDSNKDLQKMIQEIADLKQKMSRFRNSLNSIQEARVKLLNRRQVANNQVNLLAKKISDLETQITQEEKKTYELVWSKVNPNYENFLNNLKLNHSCPMCNNVLNDIRVTKFIGDDNKCFLCETEIINSHIPTNSSHNLKEQQKELQLAKQYNDIELIQIKEKLDELDYEFRKHERNLFESETNLRKTEHLVATYENKSSDDFEFKAMLAEITRLEEEKKKNGDYSRNYEKIVATITATMDEQIISITNKLSSTFSVFAEKFLGLPSRLTYDDFDGSGKKFVPVINDIARQNPNELSESQRFFIDHSYRMSLLHFFYTTPTFFVCETPDSSLDISYEHNAANVFLQFLELPNSLILTSNLNNSEFLEYIITEAKKRDIKISYLNLLDIGKKSPIQASSNQLKEVLNKILGKFND